ncbi:MAG: sugar phosphate isomerase/epimerase [Dehalococcoidia bacterium]|nr:sugar phosphate isomerase/epimerase [Dehalococcoidia bacterium]MSQ34312.1 sugar phosphate isomerase/epimerase [Dehalococcoidia bacterium]
MFLGVAGFNSEIKQISGPTAKQVRETGFSVWQIRVNDPLAISDKDVTRIKNLFTETGLIVGQTVGNYGGGLCSADADERASAIKFVKRMVNVTKRLGGPNTYFRPGSMNPRGAWLPHSANRSQAVFDRLVDSAKQICKVAENEGVPLAVEGGVVCPLYSPERVRDFLDAVGSKMIGLNMDPVNFVGSIEDAYNTTGLLERFYRLLDGRILGAHAKDFTLVDALLPHFEEEVIGAPRAMLDEVAFLKGMEKACPKGHVLVEHYPAEKLGVAADGLRKFAQTAGIKWDTV